jgi:hypothetical protein
MIGAIETLKAIPIRHTQRLADVPATCGRRRVPFGVLDELFFHVAQHGIPGEPRGNHHAEK